MILSQLHKFFPFFRLGKWYFNDFMPTRVRKHPIINKQFIRLLKEKLSAQFSFFSKQEWLIILSRRGHQETTETNRILFGTWDEIRNLCLGIPLSPATPKWKIILCRTPTLHCRQTILEKIFSRRDNYQICIPLDSKNQVVYKRWNNMPVTGRDIDNCTPN